MKQFLSLCFALLCTSPVIAQETSAPDENIQPPRILPGETVELETFLWKNRPLIVFADTPEDPRFIQQMAYITERLDILAERDVIVFTDTDPSARGTLRKKLRPRGFMMVLIGKDGIKYLRKPLPWSAREITRTIDKLPMRQQEIRDGLSGS